MESMDWKAYQEFVDSVSIYRHRNNGVYKTIYPALGLVDETVELLDVLDKGLYRYRHEVIKEMGDVLWYLTALANDLGLDMASVVGLGEEPAIRGPDGIPDAKLAKHLLIIFLRGAGKIAGRVKKALRDDGGEITADRLADLSERLLIQTLIFHGVCSFLNQTVQGVAEENMNKLGDRQNRNVLEGDGDDR